MANHNLLPKSLSGQTGTPKPRIDLKVKVKEDYVHVPSASAAPPPPRGKEGGTLRYLGDDKESSKMGMELPAPAQAHPRLAGLASSKSDGKSDGVPPPAIPASSAALLSAIVPDPTADAAIIRKLILDERNRGLKSTAQSADRKHWYQSANISIGSVEQTLALSRIIGGTSSSQRLTNTVGLKHLTFRGYVERQPQPNLLVTAGARTPIIKYLFWRDKVPATPGTAPAILGTDTNPPSSTSLILSRLGQTDTAYNSIAVFNPVTALEYHIYGVHTINANADNYQILGIGVVTAQALPQKWHFEHKLNLGEVRQMYANQGATAPDVNDIYFTIYSDMSYTGQGFFDNVIVTSDMEYEDLQDG